MPYIFNSNITINQIRGATQINVELDGHTTSVTAPKGSFVVGLVIKPEQDEVLQVSDVSEGGTELETDFPVYTDQSGTIGIMKKYDVATPIYITGNNGSMNATLIFL